LQKINKAKALLKQVRKLLNNEKCEISKIP
jgi:hypothetical protein